MAKLATVALLVADYDEAIGYFVDRVGFVLVEDTVLSADKRWVVVSPGEGGAQLLLAKAANGPQIGAVGRQTGGRVGFFLETDDFDRDYAVMSARGVRFIEAPRQEAFGTVAVFEDLYGNKWDLIERDVGRAE